MREFERVRRWGLVSFAVLLSATACTTESQRLEQGRLGEFARFGRDVDMSGARAVVGAYQENAGEGAVYVFQRIAEAWSIEARLQAPSPSREEFGNAVAISGTTIAVGAPLRDQPGAFGAGAVYVYARAGGAWSLQATLSAPAPQAQEAFGVAVALDGDWLAVGAVDHDQGGATDAGAVFVYQRSAGVWSLVQQLAAPSPVASDKYGNALALEGTTLAVSALRREVGGLIDAGSVFVYERGATFALAQTLTASDAAAEDLFGVSLAIDVRAGGRRRLAVGAEGADVAGASSAGAAYVFDAEAAGAFAQTQRLVASDPAANALFGDAVAVSGSRILVGAPGVTGAALESGAVYAFELDGAWTEQQKIERAPSDARAFLGSAVALRGSHALLGATGEELGVLFEDTGAVHAYVAVGDSFLHSHVLSAAAQTPSEVFGRRLSLAGDTLAVLAVTHSDVFDRDAFGWSLEQHFPAPERMVWTGIATDGGSLAIAARRDASGPPVGLVHVYTRVAGAWALQQAIEPDLAATALPDEAADSMVVAIQGDTLVIGARRWNGGDGRVFVYERAAGGWTASQLFTSPQAETNFDLNFGNHVELDGNTLIVAEVPSSGVPGSPQNGNVFVYTREGAAADFVQQQVLTETTPSAGDRFGAGIALDGDRLAVYSGAAEVLRVYRRRGETFAEVWSETIPDVNALSVFDVGLDMAGDRIAIGAPRATFAGATSAGEVRVLERRRGDDYVVERVLRAAAPVTDLGLGRAVAIDGERVAASIEGNAGRVYDFEL